MPDYEFALRINNERKSINPRNGFNINYLSSLLSGLNRATNPGDNSICSLYRVDNHGYTPHFITNSYDRYQSFINVHRKLTSLSMAELSSGEKYYANTLKRVLSNDKKLLAFDNENQVINTIDSATIGNGVEASYNIITSIEGVIRQIGSKNLTKGTHIMLNGVPYKIMTNMQQDTKLGAYYKGAKLSLEVRQKCSLEDGHVLYAVLLSYRMHSDKTLLEGIEGLQNVEFNLDSDLY
jgi:hypothetical protein